MLEVNEIIVGKLNTFVVSPVYQKRAESKEREREREREKRERGGG